MNKLLLSLGEIDRIWYSHAAFPVAVTPDLLYYLWANFQCDRQGKPLNIPWIAVADVLFSGLFREVAPELYQMDREVRQELLNYLQSQENLGQGRLRELAAAIWYYIQSDLESNDPQQRDFAEAQRITVLAYLQPQEVIKDLRKIYGSLDQPTEIVRMESLVEIIQEPLREFPEILSYAHSLGHSVRGNEEKARQHLQKVPRKDKGVEIAGVYYPLPESLQIRGGGWTRRRFVRTLGWSLLGIGAARIPFLVRDMPSNQLPGIQPVGLPKAATLTPFDFETKTVNLRGEVIRTEAKTASFFSQPLGSQAQPLEMVAIPGGEFTMGSPPTETGHQPDEAPQRLVKVPPFYMSKFPITQAQWQAIATQPKVELDLNPTPSYFKGANRPVEQVNWYEAVEFCKRLTNLLEGKLIYRLPSEAEWEYACRGGTTTPFAFGETMTGELANYYSSRTFAQEKPVPSKGETTDVGQFPPNAFGLYDMHGQVWEWCEDDWHDNYEGAPTDGSAWLKSGENAQKSSNTVLRGGSWVNYPVNCRSACRYNYLGRVNRNNDIGFRVLCVVGRTQ
jgi:formylglycine-generating enzyme required for sulfatase activity